MTARISVCARCGRTRRHQGRGLCGPCYTAAWRAGQIDQYPLTSRPGPAADTVHGTPKGWSWHRRAGNEPCKPCRRAQTRYATWRKLRRAEGQAGYLDAGPVREHLAQLVAAGMTVRSISLASGVGNTTLRKVLDGQRTIRPSTLAVLAVTGPLTEPAHPTDETFVSRLGSVRRIQALQRLGWRHEDLRAGSGIHTSLILSQPGQWVTVRTHAAIASAYERLCMRLGPSARTRRRAEAKGWLPPLAWEDDAIDDHLAWPSFGVEDGADLDRDDPAPDEVAVLRLMVRGAHWRNVPCVRADRIEALRRLAADPRRAQVGVGQQPEDFGIESLNAARARLGLIHEHLTREGEAA